MSIKITKKYQFHFFINFIKQKDYMTQKHFSSECENEERRRRKKEKTKRKLDSY